MRTTSVFALSRTTVLAFLIALTLSSVAAAEEVTLLFNYSGVINQEAVDGQAVLNIDTATGEFTADQWFQQFPETFNPLVAGASLLSVSCSNGARSDGFPNVITLSQGDYTSTRRVVAFDSNGTNLGDFTIEGRFNKVSDNTFEADVLLSGHYNGPVDIVWLDGYSLPTAPVPSQPDTLFGTTNVDLTTTSGQVLSTRHEHTYVFEEGVTQPLGPNIMDVTYTNGHWSPEDLVLDLQGISVMRPDSNP